MEEEEVRQKVNGKSRMMIAGHAFDEVALVPIGWMVKRMSLDSWRIPPVDVRPQCGEFQCELERSPM